jgi:predicted TPR repeat methyltransferase
MVKDTQQIYDEIASEYDAKYVEGDNNPYMFDEMMAGSHFKLSLIFNIQDESQCPNNKIISLGCGTGQDVEILGNPQYFVGYDISEEMLKVARKKFPHQNFIQRDCSELIDTNGDILVSIFGTPNYIGPDMLKKHYEHMGCKHGFFVFYNEDYKDGVVPEYHVTSEDSLKESFKEYSPRVLPLYTNSNYYVVAW